MAIIGINGYINSGKDTVGSIIQYLTEYPNSKNQTDGKNRSYNSFIMDLGMGYIPKAEIKKFAEKLKQIASLLTGIPREKFEDQEFKKTLLGDEWSYIRTYPDERVGMTVREFLQKLGTEGIRDGVHTNAWVNALFADYHEKYDIGEVHENGGVSVYPDDSNWIITDTRFPNEAQAIKDRGGIVVRINRNIVNGVYVEPNPAFDTQRHPSETSLDSYPFDYTIDNSGSIEELIEKVREMLIKFKII